MTSRSGLLRYARNDDVQSAKASQKLDLRWQLDELREALRDPIASLLPIILYMVLIWGAMEWLRRKGWVSKI